MHLLDEYLVPSGSTELREISVLNGGKSAKKLYFLNFFSTVSIKYRISRSIKKSRCKDSFFVEKAKIFCRNLHRLIRYFIYKHCMAIFMKIGENQFRLRLA